MRVNKCVQFVNDLNYVLNTFDRNYVKKFIGDSTNNNRTLTVNQVVRFLRSYGYITQSRTLQTLYKRLNSNLLDNRYNYRTDAIDINEFLETLQEASNNTVVVRSLSQVIARAA